MTTLAIYRCHVHQIWAVCVDEDETGGTRVTPTKCCGRWDRVHAWALSPREWGELAELASIAADAPAPVITPRPVTPPKNFSPPHPVEVCPCDVCATWRQFRVSERER